MVKNLRKKQQICNLSRFWHSKWGLLDHIIILSPSPLLSRDRLLLYNFCASMGNINYSVAKREVVVVYILPSIHSIPLSSHSPWINLCTFNCLPPSVTITVHMAAWSQRIIPSQMVNDYNCKSTVRISPVQKLFIGVNNSIVEMSKSVPLKTTQVFSHILFSLVSVFIWL